MPIDLVTLLKAAPFPENERQKIFANLDKLTDEHKEKLVKTAWFGLAQMYEARLEYEYELLKLEVLQEKRKYNQEDFIKAKKKVTSEILQKLNLAETQETVAKVRQELQKHLKK